MKNIFLTAAAFLLLTVAGCKKDDNNVTTTVTAQAVTTTVTSGVWVVTYYFDTDHEETSNFAGYKFSFQSNGTLSAANDVLAWSGTWTAISDSNKTKLVLNFASPADFQEISEDWEVIERTDTRIKLQHVSGGNGGTDFLTFEKS